MFYLIVASVSCLSVTLFGSVTTEQVSLENETLCLNEMCEIWKAVLLVVSFPQTTRCFSYSTFNVFLYNPHLIFPHVV